jgi:hypothetical protein
MMTKLRWTRHGQKRRKEMNVTEHRAEACILDAEKVYPDGKGHTCYADGELVVIVSDDNDAVITVLWDGAEGRDV